jgi:hypothetical protein
MDALRGLTFGRSVTKEYRRAVDASIVENNVLAINAHGIDLLPLT